MFLEAFGSGGTALLNFDRDDPGFLSHLDITECLNNIFEGIAAVETPPKLPGLHHIREFTYEARRIFGKRYAYSPGSRHSEPRFKDNVRPRGT